MRTTPIRARALCGVLFLTTSALAIASPAAAQDTAPATAPQDASADPVAADGDIVVVAQGRSQLLSNVPVAISAVSAESLQNSGANDIRQLNQVAPSLLVSSTGNEANGSARIRGIGTVGDNPGLESSVAVFIDGVYRSRSGIGLNELGEIDRVEVLRGPQGTLGGRNSSAGLISIFSKKPDFHFGANGEITGGNYGFFRVGGSVTGPITQTLAARLDGIYVRRNGFYNDANNSNTSINNRDRYFIRGQLLYEPSDTLSFRLIGDYTHRSEKCCAATYVDQTVNNYIGDLNNVATPLNSTTGNNIVNVLRDLGQNLGAFNQGYSREVSVSPGRTFHGTTTDYGGSLEADWNLSSSVKLTSITAYREYKNSQASDTDYSTVDILYRADDTNNQYRQFHTFTQEFRLQGSLFNDHLDWLVGAFYTNEQLTVKDNLRFGRQYGRFATCRLVTAVAPLAAGYSPTTPGCVSAPVRAGLLAANGGVGAFGAATTGILAGLDRLDTLNDLGSTVDIYKQTSNNYAFFTHNIIHLTDRFDITLGLRWTHDTKKFNALFGNDNTVCTAQQAAAASQGPLAGSLIGLSCQGNSTAELNGVRINSTRSESEFTGTAIASWRPIDHLLLYASYSRGYKAGGFNLDRSALKSPISTFAAAGGAQSLVGNLQFDPELVNAYEIGGKYSTGPFSVSIAAFREEFTNFQLNTFNGSVFLVQTINGCDTALGTTDSDQNLFPAGANFSAAAATTGACAANKTSYGVRSQGVELELALRPAQNFRVAAGFTYTDSGYRDDLVGNRNGAPLDPALRRLPGSQLSNAPYIVATSSVTWTPSLGHGGLTGLVYVDGRLTSDYNTGSDLFPQKGQDGFFVANARVGIRGPDERWSIELWSQNVFNKQYAQVAFNTPFQAGNGTPPFVDPQYPGGRQLISQFLAEPRTFGATIRGRF